ncbi:MAG: Dabb family protein [Chitinophagaceae bacterium]|nr:Dabb family protein [Chitinophagaceae bacterium]
MKKLLLLTFITIVIYSMTSAQQKNQQPLLRHVVMFGWKDGTDTANINKIVAAFRELPSKIPVIKSFEWGINNSPESLNNGLTHCFVATFSSEADRDVYLVHPAHKAFVSVLKPAPDKITVLDYWVKP